MSGGKKWPSEAFVIVTEVKCQQVTALPRSQNSQVHRSGSQNQASDSKLQGAKAQSKNRTISAISYVVATIARIR
jgi:hypothetical protein